MLNRKFIILFFVITYTNFLGLLNTELNTLIIPLRDYSLILVFFYLFDRFYKKRINQQKNLTLPYLKFSLYIALIALLVILSMPFRGDITLIEAFKAGRLFFTLLISIVIYDEIVSTKSIKFISDLILYFAIFYTFLAILNNIVPDFVVRIFVGGDTLVSQNSWDTGSSRFVLKGNAGIYFIHLGFVFKFFQYLSDGRRENLRYTIFLGLGMLLHGYRSPMIAFLLSSFLVAVKRERLKKLFYIIPATLFILLIGYGIEQLLGQDIIVSKFVSAYQELTGDYQGTLEGRLDRSLSYQIPMFLKSMWFGYGFVHKDSNMAVQLGHKGDGLYSLYYIDYGYGTLLNIFGLVGTIIILLLIVRVLLISNSSAKKNSSNYYYEVLLAFIIGMLITNYSFGLLISTNGLLPLGLILGFVQGANSLENR